jgi:hypothetical protein
MGGSSWSRSFYDDRVADRIATNTPTFKHDVDVRAGKAPALHKNLDPKGVTRESRDSTAHPNSLAIAVMFDVTGSMAGVPVTLQQKLAELMGILLRKGVVDPQVLMGAIGDFYADQAPLQVGQFESGIEMDDDITKIFLEKGGGGQNTESYQNALYFAARHTSIDCVEKRNHKGYLFLMGDEHAYPSSTKAEVLKIFGDHIEADITTKQLVKEASEKYEIFFFIPNGTNHYDSVALKNHWNELLGAERVIKLEKPETVCEAIAGIVGMFEGVVNPDDIAADLRSAGAHADSATAVASALDHLAKSTALTRAGATATLPETKKKSTAVERL